MVLLSTKASSYSNTMLWAMCYLAYFGFLRVSEFTIPRKDSYDLTTHLSLKDIFIDSRDSPRLLCVGFHKAIKDRPIQEGYTAILRSNRQHSLSDQGKCFCM